MKTSNSLMRELFLLRREVRLSVFCSLPYSGSSKNLHSFIWVAATAKSSNGVRLNLNWFIARWE